MDEYLEYPSEAFDYYRGIEIEKVIYEEKHTGSRAIVIVAKNEDAVRKTFGIEGEGIGVIYTRTGRAYFNDKETEQALPARVNSALFHAGLRPF